MELNFELTLQNLNATSTDDRRNGIVNFLDAIKNYYRFDLNETNANLNKLFSNQLKTTELFSTISRLLRDPDWRIRKDTFEILITIITKDVLKENIDYHFSTVMKHLTNCLSDSAMTVRKSATQCLHEYLNKSINFELSLSNFLRHGLSADLDWRQRQNTNQALQLVLTPNFSSNDFSELIVAVLRQLEYETEIDNRGRIESIVIGVLKSLKKLVGNERFCDYVLNLPNDVRGLYNRCSNSLDAQSPPSFVSNGGATSGGGFQSRKFRSLSTASVNEIVYFGFIPQSIIDEAESGRKLEAIESINNLLLENFSSDSSSIFVPHLSSLLDFIIDQLMNVDQYLVSITGLKLVVDIVCLLPSIDLGPHLEPLLKLLRQSLGGNTSSDTLVLKRAMALAMALFRRCNTRQLIVRLCDSQQFLADQKQPAVRQTTIDIITSALLHRPSTDFDLDFVCSRIAARLIDKKPKVRQAALECISVINYNYGNGKMGTVLKIVEQATKSDTSYNALEAVKTRLSKHRLPHLDDHGIVVYVTDIDKINSQRQTSINDLENSSSDNSPISSANPLEMRRPSAGKVRGRAKFPWDQNEGNTNSHNKVVPLSKTMGLNSQNQIVSSDSLPNQYNYGQITVSGKEVTNEGIFVRKFNDISLNNNESDRMSNKSQQGFHKSNSTENQSSTSGHTSGYSSGSNTYRNLFENSKPNKEVSTATNSTNVTPRNNPQISRYEDLVQEPSPIPTKPALGRSAGSRRKENDTSFQNTNNSDTINSERNRIEVLNDEENQNDLFNSHLIQGVRNSASKKKALKLFNSSSQSMGSSNGSDLEINNVNSHNSHTNNGKIQSDNTNSQKANETQNISNPHKGTTLKSNPQYSALIVGKSVVGSPIEPNDVQQTKKKQPIKGIHHSFSLAQMSDINSSVVDKNNNENFNSDINIKNNITLLTDGFELKNTLHKNGSGFSGVTINSGNDNELNFKTTSNPRQKYISETPVSPLYFSVNYLSGEDNCSNPLSTRVDFNIIGKSMLETSTPNYTQRSVMNNNQTDVKRFARGEFQPSHGSFSHSESLSNNFNNGIIGIGLGDKINKDEDSDEEPNRGIMSNTLRESLSLKRQKAENEFHSSKTETNIIPNVPASYSAPGSGSHQASHRKPPVVGYYYNNNLPSSAGNEREITNGYETVPPSRKPLRPAIGNSTPKKIKPVSQIMSNPQINSAADSMSINPAPLNNPEKSINECLTLIKNEDWENKISALIIMQSLVQFHSEFLIARSGDIHAMCIALCKECKNLRSQVAKCAIQTVSQLFVHLRKNMDSVLENVVSNLLTKAGEGTNSFLKQDVESALAAMIENVSPNRAFVALLQTGSDHKNIAIRRLTACNIMMLCDKLGSNKTMSCIKEMPDKILTGIVKFAMDGNQETRYYGKKILSELSKHSDFEKMCNKHIPEKDLRVLKDILDNIKVKGIGDPPQSSHSAGVQRSGSLSRGGSAGNLVALSSKSSSLSRGSSRSMIRLPGSELTDDDKDWLTQTCSQLSSSDFRDRQSGLESLLNKAEVTGLQMPQKSISKLLKEFIPRLNDNNTKVTITALEVCQKIIPLICSIFPTEIFSEFINTISLNFASKSQELRNTASNLMDVCFANLDHSLMIQPCIEAINKSNPRTKPMLIENMNKLLLVINSSKMPSLSRSIGMITRHLIPALGLLLDKNKPLLSNLRDPVHKLVLISYEIIGTDMIDSVAQRGDNSLKQAIIEILHVNNINFTQ